MYKFNKGVTTEEGAMTTFDIVPLSLLPVQKGDLAWCVEINTVGH